MNGLVLHATHFRQFTINVSYASTLSPLADIYAPALKKTHGMCIPTEITTGYTHNFLILFFRGTPILPSIALYADWIY
jgi:hypothetical protein